MRKVLLINAKRRKCNSTTPHLGLAMLASVLKSRGYKVLVVDYQFRHLAPPIDRFIKEFNPDVVGITLYTATMWEANEIIDKVSKFDVPLMVGGPHATLYSNDLLLDNRLDYIVMSEAENIIAELVKGARCQDKPQLIKSTLPDLEKIPYPDFTSFFQYQEISAYPLSTSRGCPYNCSFCAVHLVSSRKWRSRKPRDCLDELIRAKTRLPRLKNVIIYDDNPMVKPGHLKEVLKGYIKRGINLPLTIINSHAKGIDNEILLLLKETHCPSIALGVEHGHPEVFSEIGKGESLEDIKSAAQLIKKHKIPLGLCFIIGLPGDSLERTKYSLNLAKKLKGDFFYWNTITPFRGTRSYEWFKQPGRKVFSVIDHSSWVDGDFVPDGLCIETPEFSISDQEKAYFAAILKTGDRRIKILKIPRLLPYIIRYRLYLEFFSWLLHIMKPRPKSVIFLFKQAIRIYREKGMKEMIKKGWLYLQTQIGFEIE